MTQEEEKKKGELYRVNGFNAFASDLISLQRALKDIRHPEYVYVFSMRTVCGVVVCVHIYMCMCVCVRACVHAFMRVCVCVCVYLTVCMVTFVLCVLMLVLFCQLPAEEVFEGATNSQHHPSFPQ